MPKPNAFVLAYIECMYFTDTGDGDQPSSDVELAPSAQARAEADCAQFQIMAAHLLTKAYDRDGYDETRAAHDFWYTRNGHGVGYWDRDELDADGLGEQLTEAAKLMGECWTEQGDDGLLYIS